MGPTWSTSKFNGNPAMSGQPTSFSQISENVRAQNEGLMESSLTVFAIIEFDGSSVRSWYELSLFLSSSLPL